jgi:hypothetical protein
MTGRLDLLSIGCFGIGSMSGIIAIVGLLMHISLITIAWGFIFLISIATIAYTVNRMILLYLGEKVVKRDYAGDRLSRVVHVKRISGPTKVLRAIKIQSTRNMGRGVTL